MTLACLHGDAALDRLVLWFTPERFERALLLVVGRRWCRGQYEEATFERMAFEMSSTPGLVRRYRTGEHSPTRKSLYFINEFLLAELGADWMKVVDVALDEAGGNTDRPAHTASAKDVF